MKVKIKKSNNISFYGLLTILFVGLKLTNYIDWSWWWVLSPLLIPTAIVVGGLIVCGILALVFTKC